MIKPFYQADGVTIYHGDAKTILPTLDRFDLLLTDPPYGIGRDGKRKSTSRRGGHKGYKFRGWDNKTPTPEEFELMFEKSRDQVIWGANYFTKEIPPTMGWLVWDKGQRISQSDGELAFTSRQNALRVFELNRAAIRRDGAVHPTQKPLALMQWCLSFFPKAETVLDPYMGSGTTLLAAKLAGKTAVGVDQCLEYCEIAADRLRQKVLQAA